MAHQPRISLKSRCNMAKKINQYKVNITDKEVKPIEGKSTQITSDTLSTLE